MCHTCGKHQCVDTLMKIFSHRHITHNPTPKSTAIEIIGLFLPPSICNPRYRPPLRLHRQLQYWTSRYVLGYDILVAEDICLPPLVPMSLLPPPNVGITTDVMYQAVVSSLLSSGPTCGVSFQGSTRLWGSSLRYLI